MTTRLILFDIDGTLIRTGGAGVKAFALTAEQVFGCPGGTESLRFHGRTDVSLIREFFTVNGLPDSEENIQRFLAAYVHFLDREMQRHGGEVCPGVRELLGALRVHPEGPVMGLLTGNVRLGAGLKLRAHGLSEHFELGAFGDDHEDRNELARIALRRGSDHVGRPLTGEDVVVIGDTRADIECARAIQARCLAVATGGHSLRELQGHSPALAVESLAGITAEQVVSLGRPVERLAEQEAPHQVENARRERGQTTSDRMA